MKGRKRLPGSLQPTKSRHANSAENFIGLPLQEQRKYEKSIHQRTSVRLNFQTCSIFKAESRRMISPLLP